MLQRVSGLLGATLARGLGADVVVDPGAATLRLLRPSDGAHLALPSAVVVSPRAGHRASNEVAIAFGSDAQALVGREPVGARVVRPLRAGRVWSESQTDALLLHALAALDGARPMRASRLTRRLRLMVLVPADLDDPSRARWSARAEALGIAAVHLAPAPLATLRGLGVPPSDRGVHLLVDVGASATQIALVRGAGDTDGEPGVVAAATVEIGGDTFDATLQRALRRDHHLAIGPSAAATLKHHVDDADEVWVSGRCLRTGLPRVGAVAPHELRAAIMEPAAALGASIRQLLQQAPPDAVAAAAPHGALLVGGGSHVAGLDAALRDETGLPVLTAEEERATLPCGVRAAAAWAKQGEVR
jgi:rod shape-determining protein MreB